MGVMKRQVDRVLFYIAYRVVHQPFFGLMISSQVLTAFAIHYHKGRNCLESIGWLFFETISTFLYITLCIWAPHRGGVFKLGSNNGFINSLFGLLECLVMWLISMPVIKV